MGHFLAIDDGQVLGEEFPHKSTFWCPVLLSIVTEE